jgi:sulfate-transporting ATPase
MKLIEKQGELTEKLDHHNAWELDNRLNTAMEALRCPPDDAVKVLSGGERRRVALCRLLLSNPDILLLDEPTNHLDAESVDWLEQYLQNFPGTVIAVTHDRYFLDNVAGWILELDRGEGIPWKGNYSSWLEQKAKRLEQEEKAESKRRKTLQARTGVDPHGAQGPPAKGKARLNAYDKLAGEEIKKKKLNWNLYPARAASGRCGHRYRSSAKASASGLIEDLTFHSQKRHSGDHRPERGREKYPLPHDHGRGAAG